MPRCGADGSYGRFIFTSLRVLHTDFQSGWTSLPPTVNEGPLLPTSSLAFAVRYFVGLCRSGWAKKKFQNCFDFISLIARNEGHFFKRHFLAVFNFFF